MRARLGLLLAFVVGCAEDGKDGLDGTPVEIDQLAAGSQQCPNGGVLITVGNEARPVCNGARGTDGQTGPAGQPGMNGEPGSDYQPMLSILCNAAVDVVNAQANQTTPQAIGTDGVKESYFQYSVVVFSNNDAQTACGVTLGSLATSSGGTYYAGTSMGAASRYCQVIIDYPPAGASGGLWAFTVDDDTPVATYSDTDVSHPLDGDYVGFVESECAVRKFVDGAWVTGSFADL